MRIKETDRTLFTDTRKQVEKAPSQKHEYQSYTAPTVLPEARTDFATSFFREGKL